MKTPFWMMYLAVILLFSWTCRVEEPIEISITPATIIAGLGDVVLTVSGTPLPSGASIEADGVAYATSSSGSNSLHCTLPRTATVPVEALSVKRRISIRLVDSSRQPVSNSAELTVLRDYSWGSPQIIANLPYPDQMSVHPSATGPLLFCRHDTVLRQIESRNGGLDWEAPLELFTLSSAYDPYVFIPQSGSPHRLLVLMDNAITLFNLPDGTAESSAGPVPSTQACETFSACLDDSGRLHMVWDQRQSDYNHVLVHYAWSDDLGDNWSKSVVVLDDPGHWPTYWGIKGLAVFNDHLFVSYVTNQGRYQFDKGRCSHDGGLSWSDGTALDSAHSLLCRDQSLVRYGKIMHLPYMYRPFISRSQDWGDTWTSVFYPEPDEFNTVDSIISDSWGNLLGELSSDRFANKIVIRSFDYGASWIIPDGSDISLPPRNSLTKAFITGEGEVLLFFSSYDIDGIWLNRAPVQR